MSVHSCSSADSWKTMENCKVGVDGEWKQCASIHANVDGSWKKVWPITTITITSDNVENTYTDDWNAIASLYPQVITVSEVSGDRASDWVVPDNSQLCLGYIPSTGYIAEGVYYEKTSDTTWGNPSMFYPGSIAVGTYSIGIRIKESSASYHYTMGLDGVTIINKLGTMTIKEEQKFLDPFYPYFSSTGNQHTTGIGLNQPDAMYDLVIRKYTSSSSEGELFPAGTQFRLDQKGQGSGYAIFDLDSTGSIANIYNNSGWTIKAFYADSAVLTAVDGGAYWWDGTKAVSSVTLTIN